MAILPIRLYPDPILRKKSENVTKITRHIISLCYSLIQTMDKQKHGIGIAAPQVGVLKRVAIVDVSKRVKGAQRLVLINPTIVTFSESCLSREGCMSLPEYSADLSRYRAVRVRYLDLKGNLREKHCEGIEAVCMQHETDHLDGLLFFDRVSCLKTDLFPRR